MSNKRTFLHESDRIVPGRLRANSTDKKYIFFDAPNSKDKMWSDLDKNTLSELVPERDRSRTHFCENKEYNVQ
jgi:hypothetical protein